MAQIARPNPENVMTEGGDGTKSVDPKIDVFSRRSPWQGKYDNLIDFPSPLDFGNAPWQLQDDLKWAMLRDPQVFAGYMLWKTGVLVDGWQIYPSENVKDSSGKESKTRSKLSKEIAEICLYAFSTLEGGFDAKMLQLLDCCVSGHKAGVQIFRQQTGGRWKNKLVLDRIRMMPNNSYRVRVDEFGRYRGLQNINQLGDDEIYDKSKFIYSVFRPHDDNPLGTNILWPAYGAWYEKQQIAPERLSNMAQFGSPSLFGITPQGVGDIELLDSTGAPLRYPMYQDNGQPHPKANQTVRVPMNIHMLEALKNFQGNGSVTVVPFSSDIKKIEANNGGDLFRFYTDDKNFEILRAMLFTTTWTEQQKHGSNATAQTGSSIGQFSLVDGKNMLANLCMESLCRNMVLYNYGEEYLDLIPTVTFGNIQQSQLSSLYNAIAALWSTGFFDDSQRRQLVRMMGLPEPDPDATRPPQGQPTGNVLVNNKQSDNNSNGNQNQNPSQNQKPAPNQKPVNNGGDQKQ